MHATRDARMHITHQQTIELRQARHVRLDCLRVLTLAKHVGHGLEEPCGTNMWETGVIRSETRVHRAWA